jgi:hypothetical protein
MEDNNNFIDWGKASLNPSLKGANPIALFLIAFGCLFWNISKIPIIVGIFAVPICWFVENYLKMPYKYFFQLIIGFFIGIIKSPK